MQPMLRRRVVEEVAAVLAAMNELRLTRSMRTARCSAALNFPIDMGPSRRSFPDRPAPIAACLGLAERKLGRGCEGDADRDMLSENPQSERDELSGRSLQRFGYRVSG